MNVIKRKNLHRSFSLNRHAHKILIVLFYFIFQVFELKTVKAATKNHIRIKEKVVNRLIQKNQDLNNQIKIQKFTLLVDKLIKKIKIPGLAICVITKDKVLYKNVYGVRKKHKNMTLRNDNNNQITENTVFYLASVSKSITSYLVYKLIQNCNQTSEQGSSVKISLDDSIFKYIPNIKIHDTYHSKQIKIKHMLSHSTGIKQYCLEKIAYMNQPPKNLFSKLSNAIKIENPGKCFAYQNVIYSLISPILQSVYKKNFKEIFREEILEKLNLEDTVLSEKALKETKNRAYPHIIFSKNPNSNRGFSPVTSSSYYYNILPAGGIASSINDMIKILQSIMQDYEYINFITHFSVPTPIKKKLSEDKEYNKAIYKRIISWQYCIGWYREKYANVDVFFHYGNLTGYRTLIQFCPELNIGIVILVNCASHKICSILRHYIVDLFLDLNSYNL